jgi:hypothetical protein
MTSFPGESPEYRTARDALLELSYPVMPAAA